MSRKLLIVFFLLSMTGSATDGQEYRPKLTGVITDLQVDAAEIMRQLPGIISVTVPHPVEKPTHRIIHLRDWHLVSKESFAADLRDQDKAISDKEIDRQYSDHLNEVEAVQEEQMALLRCLIKHHGLRKVCIEGLTPQDKPTFETQVKLLRTLRKDLAELRAQRDDLAKVANDESSKKLLANIDAVLFQNRCDLLRLGAAGRLYMGQELESVLPVEEERTYRAAQPVLRDGRVELNHKVIEAREDAQVKKMLAGGPFALVILGGSHDLADNIKRLADGKCELIVVESSEFRNRS